MGNREGGEGITLVEEVRHALLLTHNELFFGPINLYACCNFAWPPRRRGKWIT